MDKTSVIGFDIYNMQSTGMVAKTLTSIATDSDHTPVVCYIMDSFASNSMKSSNPNSGFHEASVVKCIGTDGLNPACNQGGAIVVQKQESAMCFHLCGDRDNPYVTASDKAFTVPANPMSDRQQFVCYPINTMVATRWEKDDMRTCFGIGEPGDPQFTISAAHMHAVCYQIHESRKEEIWCDKAAGFKGRQGSRARSIGYVEECTPTLNAEQEVNVVIALEGNGSRPSHRGSGYNESGKMFTLNTIEVHSVCYGIDQQGGKGMAGFHENVCPTLCSDSHGTPHAVCYKNEEKDEE